MSKPTPAAGTSFVEAMDFVANSRSVEPVPAMVTENSPASTPTGARSPAAVAEVVPVGEEAVPAATQPAGGNQPAMERKEVAISETVDYASTFLRPVRTRKTRSIYVDEALHRALSVLTQVAGVGLADLLINIANDHFERHRPVIRQYLSDQEKLRKKELPF